jgi:hypothetical protein
MRPHGTEPILSFGRMPLHANGSRPANNHSMNIGFAHLTPSWLRQNNPTGKIALNLSGKSPLKIRPSHPARGALAIVTNAGWDAVDATALGVTRDRRAA